MTGPPTLTPPELAKRWRVKPSKIIGFIRRGELRAFDVAANTAGRPRYRITIDAVIAFENCRAAKPTVTKGRRKKRDETTIEFFK